VLVLPINAANARTSGIDVAAHYSFEAGPLGSFAFNLGFTDVLTHTIQLYPGDPVDNELTDWYNYVIPRTKASASGSWTIGPLTTTIHDSRIGGLPNYDGTQRLGATSVYNASFNYRIAPRATFTLIIDNLFDTQPYRDSTWTSYPYYPTGWFSPVGRAFFAEINVKLGGSQP
jgi:iron complex outermembrane recepter protein